LEVNKLLLEFPQIQKARAAADQLYHFPLTTCLPLSRENEPPPVILPPRNRSPPLNSEEFSPVIIGTGCTTTGAISTIQSIFYHFPDIASPEYPIDGQHAGLL
jgi:hypothetical protein